MTRCREWKICKEVASELEYSYLPLMYIQVYRYVPSEGMLKYTSTLSTAFYMYLRLNSTLCYTETFWICLCYYLLSFSCSNRNQESLAAVWGSLHLMYIHAPQSVSVRNLCPLGWISQNKVYYLLSFHPITIQDPTISSDEGPVTSYDFSPACVSFHFTCILPSGKATLYWPAVVSPVLVS